VYDVIIIGAGPAGTACGYDLVAAGFSVLILDRHDFPRKKACAGGITPKAMALFAYDISHFVVRACREVNLRRPGGHVFEVKNAHPLCYMVQRRDLDDYSLNKVTQCGGRFLKIDQILSLDQSPEGVAVRYACDSGDKTCRARYLIGADGANSRIRRLLGRPEISIARCPALEADVKVDRPEDFTMELDFSKGIPGYYWIFPKQDYVNIGIFGARPGVSMNRQLLGGYARERLGNDTLEAVRGYPIGTGYGRPCAGLGRVMLVGDAAGFAEPLFGEGIYFALKSGRLAAHAIGKGGGGNCIDQYRRSLARVVMDLKFHALGAGILYRFPRLCLSIAGNDLIHGHFSKGYARGRTISQMLLPFHFSP